MLQIISSQLVKKYGSGKGSDKRYDDKMESIVINALYIRGFVDAIESIENGNLRGRKLFLKFKDLDQDPIKMRLWLLENNIPQSDVSYQWDEIDEWADKQKGLPGISRSRKNQVAPLTESKEYRPSGGIGLRRLRVDTPKKYRKNY